VDSAGQNAVRANTVRAGKRTRDQAAVWIGPDDAGWGFSGLRVIELSPGESASFVLDGEEAVVLPLSGGCTVDIDDVQVVLTGRPSVFSGPSDFVYVPLDSSVTITASGSASSGAAPGAASSGTPSSGTESGRFAVATSRATRRLPMQYATAANIRVDLRGAGSCSRQVNNYTLGTAIEVDHLLVCEVITPGGNWSSYPPHKHDAHSEDERELEEIYYFEVQASPDGMPGLAYHRVYGEDGHPADVLEEVHTGDVVLVPHGYHGPSMAGPGYDLYYLNVMAGPAEDRQWMSVDDPAHHWIRDTWTDQQIDPRLPVAADSLAAAPTNKDA
jgi:5-deoxy-glucuronate isomerase